VAKPAALPGWVKPFRRPEVAAVPEPVEPPVETPAEAPAPAVEAPVAEAPAPPPERKPEPARLSLAMPDLSDILPELALAPAPADETAAPLWESDEWAREERARRDVQSGRKTRHDSEHGSVAARSVLDRLGISGGGGSGGGGRRRADESGPREEVERTAEPVPGTQPAAAALPVETGPPWKRERPDLAPPPRPELTAEEAAAEPWLPRLRMPPSLDPLEDFDSWTPTSQPFPESYARAIAEDEPPPDAGLAELLARALAEHQAGTASAAALVKKLGSRDEHGQQRPMNGHSAGRDGKRNGSVD
jgi:hypothetical protein